MLDEVNGCIALEWHSEDGSQLHEADVDGLCVSVEVLLENTGVVPVGLHHYFSYWNSVLLKYE